MPQRFNSPHHFTKEANSRWLCNVCGTRGLTHEAAIRHEGEPSHQAKCAAVELWTANAPDVQAWDQPLEETPLALLSKEERIVREHQDHFELTVKRIIPYWRQNVADGREMLYLEAFLDSLDGEPWMNGVTSAADDWGMGTAADARRWGVEINSVNSGSHTGSRTYSSNDNDGHEFVEDIAAQEAANPGKTKRLHEFYELSTKDKIQQINDLLRSC